MKIGEIPKSIDIIADECSISSEIKRYFDGNVVIEIHSTKHPDDKINGLYTRYALKDGKTLIDVDINSKLNTCWTRMVAAKELCQLLVDKQTSMYTTDIVGLVDQFINNLQYNEISDELKSEHNALYLAIELLLPHPWNDYITDESITSYAVAQTLSVPEKMVDLVRTKRYQSLRDKAYEL